MPWTIPASILFRSSPSREGMKPAATTHTSRSDSEGVIQESSGFRLDALDLNLSKAYEDFSGCGKMRIQVFRSFKKPKRNLKNLR